MSKRGGRINLSVSECRVAIKQMGGYSDEQIDNLVENLRIREEVHAQARLNSARDETRKPTELLLDKIKREKVAENRNAAAAVLVYRDAEKFVAQFTSPGEGLDTFLNGSEKSQVAGSGGGVWGSIRAEMKTVYGKLVGDLEAHGLLRVFSDNSHSTDMLIELNEMSTRDGRVGITGNPIAKKLASVILATYKDQIGRLNRVGAMRELDGSPVRMLHDPAKMLGLKSGETSAEAAFDRWFNYVLPLVDIEKTFNNDLLAEPVTDVREYMKRLFEMMTHRTTGEGRFNPFIEYQGQQGLAKKWSKHVPITFKDGASMAAYMKTYGLAQASNVILHDLEKMTHAYVLMEKLGPNPPGTLAALVSHFEAEVVRKHDDIPTRTRLLAKLSKPALMRSLDYMMGRFDRPENPTIYNIKRLGLGISAMAHLPGITISSQIDRPLVAMGLRYNGATMQDSLMASLQLAHATDEVSRNALHAAGLAWQHLLGAINGRFGTGETRSTELFAIEQMFFKMTGSTWHNSIMDEAAGSGLLKILGDNSHLDMDHLQESTRRSLTHYGITKAEWELARARAIDTPNGKYIVPEAIRKIDLGDVRNESPLQEIMRERGIEMTLENARMVVDQTEMKFSTFVHDQVDAMMVTPGNRERVQLSGGVKAGTVPDLMLSWIMQFKSFPLAVWNRIVKREFYGHGSQGMRDFLLNDTMGKVRMAQLIAVGIIGGYAIQTAKDLLNFKTRRRFFEDDGSFNWDTLGSAMRQGGMMGLYGDFLLTEYDRSYQTPISMAAGPVFNMAQEPVLIGWDAIRGKNVSGSTAKYIQGNTPFINMIYIKPALDYLILWNLRELASPGSMAKYERSTEKRTHQSFYVQPSELGANLIGR